MFVCITNPLQANGSNYTEPILLYRKPTEQFLYHWEHLIDIV